MGHKSATCVRKSRVFVSINFGSNKVRTISQQRQYSDVTTPPCGAEKYPSGKCFLLCESQNGFHSFVKLLFLLWLRVEGLHRSQRRKRLGCDLVSKLINL